MRSPEPFIPSRVVCIAGGFVLVLGVYFAFVFYYLHHSVMSPDESFYAMAAVRVLEGELPYRDFGYTQMPLLPYINGALMKLVGFGFVEQRAINLTWGAIGLLAIIFAVRRRLGKWEPGFAAALLVAAAPHWTVLQAMGVAHGAAGCFLVIAASCGIVPMSWTRRAALVGLFGALSVGCRLSVAPAVAILCMIPVFEAKGFKCRLIALAIPLSLTATIIGPFFLAAPDNGLFYVWEYHVSSRYLPRALPRALEWWRTAPAAIAILAAGLAASGRIVRRRNYAELALLSAALLGVAAPMVLKSAYGNYITPVLPVAAMAGVVAVWRAGLPMRWPIKNIVWALPALSLLQPLPAVEIKPAAVSIREVADFISEHVPPGPLLTPLPIIAIEAGRDVIPGTEMGVFSVMHPRDLVRARDLNLVTLPNLKDLINRQVPAAMVRLKGDSYWNFAWQVPAIDLQPSAAYLEFVQAGAKLYQDVYVGKDFVVSVPRRVP